MHRRAASHRHGSTTMSLDTGHYTPYGPASPSASKKTLFLYLIDFLRPRKTRLRATFLCLFSLIVLTTYVCLVSPPAFSRDDPLHPYRSKLSLLDDSWRKFAPNLPTIPRPAYIALSRPDVSLSPEQELGALTAFMAALPQNVIPTNIDPAKPVDPQLVLDFDTRSPQAEKEVDSLVIDVWLSNPVVLFSKVRDISHSTRVHFCLTSFPPSRQFHSSVSRELKSILKAMDINPPPTIFDVDQRGLCLEMLQFLITAV